MRKLAANLFWLILALAGGWAFFTLATQRGETVSSAYILIAALCTYAIGYRFYSKWIAASVLTLNDRRATPCEVNDDGRDFVKTNKWIVFGHHFAAISGPGPLVGPVLAAQFGYLPGTLWILIGVVLGGAVQDFVILFASLRRNGKSLGQMVREEMNSAAGAIALVAILAILIILLGVLALVIVRTLAESPWGVFTVGATIPIAMLMGGYLRFWRVGKVLEASTFGVILLLLAVWGGQYIHHDHVLAGYFTLQPLALAWLLIAYGVAASVLPIWLLLAPRDYLSTFMKLGTIFALALGILLILPELKMPALSRFVDGSGPVVPGNIFPFCFITIACGSISGFHALISSGTTPKILTRESYARSIGYGAMCFESLVAIMALIAACALQPGVYLSMNMTGTPGATVAKATAWGFPVTTNQMDELARQSGEKTLYGRTGGAATLAVGMSAIFSKVTNGRWVDLWYHFAIMFEALFILTTLDAGTRVGRYLLQDMLGNIWKPLADTRGIGANVAASVLMVAGWGYFLIQGVLDPLGGINSLWPLFGIANQLLAAIALCLATTVILKMHLPKPGAESEAQTGFPNAVGSNNDAGSEPLLPRPVRHERGEGWGERKSLKTPDVRQPNILIGSSSPRPSPPSIPREEREETQPSLPARGSNLPTVPGRPWLALVTLIPLLWLLAVTMAAGYQKIFSASERIGFLAIAKSLDQKLPDLQTAVAAAKPGAEAVAAIAAAHKNRVLHFNNILDAFVAGFFMVAVLALMTLALREWILLLARKRPPELRETPPVWLPDYAVVESRPVRVLGTIALGCGLLRELSGEAHIERAQHAAAHCHCPPGESHESPKTKQRHYVEMTEKRFNGVNRCC